MCIRDRSCIIHYGSYNNEKVVIKVKQFLESTQDEDFLQLLLEIAILAQCNHPTIVPIKGVYFSPEGLQISIIQTRYYKDLNQILFGGDSIAIPNKKQICCQLIQALEYIHSKDVIHLDLKPQNIIFKDQSLNAICLLDFGISKIQKDSNQSTDVLEISCFYCPPEVSQTERSYVSSKSDIFSLGIVLYELTTGKRAWKNYLNKGGIAIYNLIHSQNYNFFKENVSTGNQQLDLLIQDCVNCLPKARPTAAQVLQRINKIQF
eukprot:TRINITY_DN1928_c0_g2_i6.p1 TRINITY_DN1928_c0_g2~~TRINITY_DN1928_c0_g2_i6.p1  ORF type:complete len:262 (+),score=22.25 TRINITY_DN1928_c0_g2_i6:140-925(+)